MRRGRHDDTGTSDRGSASSWPQRILVLDGAWGTMLQRQGLEDADYRGERFRDHPRDVKGDPDLLNLTRPDVVLDVHRAYLDGRRRHHDDEHVHGDVDRPGRLRARGRGLRHERGRARGSRGRRRTRPGGRFVAGSIGPLNQTLSLSPKVDDPAFRNVTFDQVRESYAEQIRGLRDGGVDLLLVETIFDTLNAKAAIVAALEEKGAELPLWISVTIVDLERPDALGPDARGVLALGRARRAADRRRQLLARREGDAPARGRALAARRHVHELPPERRPAERLRRLRRGALKTTSRLLRSSPRPARERRRRLLRHHPGTRKAIAAAVGAAPRRVPPEPRAIARSGLEPFAIFEGSNFAMIGERTNVTGSARFRRLIEAGDFTGAVDVALDQVRGGANLLDVNMDADLLDSEAAMTTFLNLLATEPEVARLPIVVDSSRWSVIQAGLKCVQGKPIVNSISLKEGEEDFLAKAREVRRFGAALVVMAFDEQGQADTVDRKVEICGRAYDLLTRRGRHPARGHHLRPEHPRGRDRDRGARRLRRRPSSRRSRGSRSAARARGSRAGSRTSRSRSAATTSCARRSTRRSSTTRSAPGSTWGS